MAWKRRRPSDSPYVLTIPRTWPAILQAVTHYNDANIIAEVSRGLGDCMPGLDVRSMTDEQRLALRGW